MTRNQIKEMILAILRVADYDLMKSYLPETTEDSEYSANELEKLIDIAERYIK